MLLIAGLRRAFWRAGFTGRGHTFLRSPIVLLPGAAGALGLCLILVQLLLVVMQDFLIRVLLGLLFTNGGLVGADLGAVHRLLAIIAVGLVGRLGIAVILQVVLI